MGTKAAFEASPYRSVKVDAYFSAYDRLFERYRNRAVTVVEIGILGGGSLFMWRQFFGPEARIIGVDLNPAAVKWREHGFEIVIGNQESDDFWRTFLAEVGEIDVLIDDGGHTNYQQIKTLLNAIPRVRDGGMVLIEDTQASYMKSFGNPRRYSFMRFSGIVADRINDRFFGRQPTNLIRDSVYSYEVFVGMVAFHIDRSRCRPATVVANGDIDDEAVDFRFGPMRKPQGVLAKIGGKIARKLAQYRKRIDNYRLCRPYFRSLK